eukprot:768267-Hanusia_phi.AAC.8
MASRAHVISCSTQIKHEFRIRSTTTSTPYLLLSFVRGGWTTRRQFSSLTLDHGCNGRAAPGPPPGRADRGSAVGVVSLH